VLPLGSTEQHAYLSLATDAILAERVSVEAAEPLDVAVLPALPYGTCRLVVHSTEIVQTIYGSIQEYGGFDRPEWLD
jgi:creatinine amidohydrolase/Fe(II)-dependent formamide hydrolase-like protein